MERIRSEGVLFFPPKLEREKEQAKAARSQFLRKNSKLLISWFGRIALICGLAIAVTFSGKTARQRVLQATINMEQLALVLESAKTIAPDTARAISQLLRQSESDCKQVACDAALERRNSAARNKLNLMLAAPTSSEQIATNSRSSLGPSK
jgi:hypothetical protein